MVEGFAEHAGFPLPAPSTGLEVLRAKPSTGVSSTGAPSTGAPSRPPVFASTGPRGHRQRMRERLLARGPGALADYEVLEMLLFLGIPRRDTKPLAKDAINRFGSLRDVLLAPAERFAGVFDRDAVPALKLVVQAADRLARAEARERPALRDWDGLDAYLASAPAPEGAGRARMLFLNNRNQLLADEMLDVAAEDPAADPTALARETVRRALALHATALILVLGRTGKPGAPTKAEVALAARLKQAAGVLSIALHDVLLAGGGARTSLRRKGVF